MIRRIVQRLGATRIGVWTIKHLIAPLDRWLYLRTGGRRVALGKPLAPTLLLTTTGRRSGQPRTTPVFYYRDGEKVASISCLYTIAIPQARAVLAGIDRYAAAIRRQRKDNTLFLLTDTSFV